MMVVNLVVHEKVGNISAEILSIIDSSWSPSFCRRFERLIVVDAGN